ncbi:MAG: cysteine hydrolase family protein [Verrucomicrobiae bacterium]|nr:cysteine hydrolase family protein [Verrucomicrobiae bacterium]
MVAENKSWHSSLKSLPGRSNISSMPSIPSTLRQLAGMTSHPAPLAESVLIIVDAQKEYTEGILPLVGIDPSIDALARFLMRAREARIPIFHVVQMGKPGGKICDPQRRFVAIIDKVRPAAGETVIEKHFPNSFAQTSLETELSKTNRKDLVIAGYMTHMCLSSTVRAAAEADYRCVVAADLTATRDLPNGKGGVMDAATIKAAHLAALADRFAIVVEKSGDIR